MNAKIRSLLKELTLEEKVSLCSGSDYWHTQEIKRLGIPSVMVSDGPNGLRKQDLDNAESGVNTSIKAVCFPAGVNLAASFDEELVESVGEAIGAECQAESVAAILAPGNNIKRSPLCGRNFEYYSEDPVLSGKTAAAYIRGVQSKGVGTSLKHFCGNNQEFRRNSSDSRIDERTLREIYLKTFEIAVKESQPWTVMCAYNLVNGVQMSENKRLLTDILRDEWGFTGLVMSDWGAVRDRVRGIAAGLDLEMPSSGGTYDSLVAEAVKSGNLSEEDLDRCVGRVLEFVFKAAEDHDPSVEWNKDEHHLLARKFADECIVLLKNDNRVLPIKSDEHALFIGGFAKKPRMQGGGSSHVNCIGIDSVLYAVQGNTKITYEEGFSAEDDSYDDAKFRHAADAAADADKVVVFAGLPDMYESEGYDRKHMDLPQVQNDLISAVADVNPHVIVVLENGSPVTMPWIDKVEAVMETYLCGEGVGVATARALYGRSNPSGRLPETFPLRLEDNPAYIDFSGDCSAIDYREGIFTGYRYYTKKKMPVLFPFGHGLSYSTFSYGRITADADKMRDDETLEVTVDVINESDVPGKEVIQLYVEADIPNTKVRRPVRELKAFKKVFLDKREKKTVSFILDKSAFAYYDTDMADWYVEPGSYKIEICRDAETVIESISVEVTPKKKRRPVYDENSVYKDLMEDASARKIAKPFYDKYINGMLKMQNTDEAAAEAFGTDYEVFLNDMTLRSVVNMSSGYITYGEMTELIGRLNKQH
ncbi:MAG: glycoside hydrolase family 3 C-terminal domain-containing protein [Lachnospiraceae bacterium]|nr:glycoside hydrolase family 3 C-terminal domain-containing protein [Lachnospiraceae bacterium]